MRVYFLDRGLDDGELPIVMGLLSKVEGLCSARDLEQVRVPMFLSSVEGNLELSVGQQMDLLRHSLANAGIGKDFGQRSMFVMPAEAHWGVKLQIAILEMTGFAPYVIERRFGSERDSDRLGIRVVDRHRMLAGAA